ncbi:MAG: ABC transporter permease [Deltaproteobacteria bacterium]|nr:ABC transporter permease [Deltaproteobacteria bacterium]
MGWRNLWRNRRRTALTMTTVGFATAILVLTQALMHGMVEGTARNATDTFVGEVQVHAPGWVTDRSFYNSLAAPRPVLAALAEAGLPAAPRAYGFGLTARANKSAGAMFWGVDPAAEAGAFDLPASLERGSFLTAAASREVVLGRKLARSLEADVGSEVIAVVEAGDGSIGNELFTVVGILQGLGETADRSAAILHSDDFNALFVAGGRIHEIAVNTRGAVAPDRLEARVVALARDADVRTWRELLPMVSDMLGVLDASLWIFSSVFLLAAGLGVTNTMLMAVYERTHEFGVLKALGTPPLRIAADVAVEALLLAVVATGIGAGAGTAGALALQRWGIDTAAWAGSTSLAGVAFDPIWRASFSLGALTTPVLTMWLVCVLAAVYPAASVARLRAVEAIGRT